MKSKPVWILELVIRTEDGAYINEPIGVYSSETIANRYLDMVMSKIFNKSNIECSLIPVFLDEAPPMLEIIEESTAGITNKAIYELYNIGAFEQMVEPDGTFSYVLTKDFKNNLEKAISKNIS